LNGIHEKTGMVVVATDHAAQCPFDLLPHVGGGLAPRVGHVGHDEHAQPVGPVELARRFHLDVLAHSVEPDLARPQHFVAEDLVAREGVEAVGVIGLVERELEVHRLVVERDVTMVGAGQVHDRDLRMPSRCTASAGPSRHRRVELVEERILGDHRCGSGMATSNRALLARASGAHRGQASRLEGQAQGQVLGRRLERGGATVTFARPGPA
jgi:hypothetical protein